MNRYGGTALIPAAHHGHPEAVRVLLGTAIDKDHVNKLGWTALLEAVILGDGGPVHTEIVRLLVEAGANVNIADREASRRCSTPSGAALARWCGFWRRGADVRSPGRARPEQSEDWIPAYAGMSGARWRTPS